MSFFNQLGLDEKCNILRQHALFVTTMTYFHYTIKLYSWDRFFIEEYFDNEQEEITRISIAGEVDLRKYIDDIDLNEIQPRRGSSA